VLGTLTLVYVASAMVTTAIVLVASRAVMEDTRPGTHRLIVALLAGLAWPVLLLGLAEMTVVAYAYVKVRGEPGIAVMA
jgi:hypothetical protein